MLSANYFKHLLEFKQPGGTSRGILHTKETFILEISDEDKRGVGECAVFRGLSYDDFPDYEEKLKWLTENISVDESFLKKELQHFPSLLFGYEQALLNLKQSEGVYFPSDFTEGKDSVKINGLIWMGTVEFMQQQIEEKLTKGFNCIKLKIGTDWNAEKDVIKKLRDRFPANQLELRVDANGAFGFEDAKEVLLELAALKIHSIEQPIKAGNVQQMSELCNITPTPIALDEELIGVIDYDAKKKLLEEIKPQYIILKPSLVGGFSGSDEWIENAEKIGTGWWITSALESNIGLNAIAQYTYTKKNPMPQGLGTGGLFTNNFESELSLDGDRLWFRKS